MRKVRKIHLYGPMAKKFGKKHEFACDNTVEVYNALKAMVPGFREYMIEVPRYVIVKSNGKKDYANVTSVGDLLMEATDIHLLPEIEGAIVAPAAIAAALAVSTAAAYAIAIAIDVLAMVALAAISQMLAPSAKQSSTGNSNDQSSFIFNGASNSAEQGVPVPLVYGRFRTGSVIINTGLSNEDIPVNASYVPNPTLPNS